MKRVAVSQRVDSLPERGETRDALDQRLVSLLSQCGALPIPVPNSLALDDRLSAWLDALKPEAVVLSGGNDVGSCVDRDATERQLIDHARLHSLPLLGICRGMQMLATWASATLKPVADHVRVRHALDGVLSRDVNSYHTQSLAACPTGFHILAKSTDGEIEAIRHDELGWEGWMWHPEREAPFSLHDIERLCTLLMGNPQVGAPQERISEAGLVHQNGPIDPIVKAHSRP